MSGSKRLKPEDVLDVARSVLAERGEDRDQANGERSMRRAVTIFNAISCRCLTEREGWEFMLALKLARAAIGDKFQLDDYVDLAGYTALLAEHRYDVDEAITRVNPDVAEASADGDVPRPDDPEEVFPDEEPRQPHTCWECEYIFDKGVRKTCPNCGTHWTYHGL